MKIINKYTLISLNNLDKEFKNKLVILLQEAAKNLDLEIFSLDLMTNQSPIIIKVIIGKTNKDYITLNDCSRFNNPASSVIENSNLLKCSYVLEISSQGVSDELTSERDFKTFKGFPVNVESVSYTNLTLPTKA